MAYNNIIPQPNDKLKNSQPQILENFAQISTLVGINHVNFNIANAGKHFFVQFPVQNPAPVTVGGEVGLYSFTHPTTLQPELYVKRENNLPAGGIPMTAMGTSSATDGWSYTSSGLLLKWGRILGSNTVVTTFNVNTVSGGPNYTTIYNVQVTAERDNGATDPDRAATIKVVANPNISVYTTFRKTLGIQSCFFNYLVIGV